jgi:hypothetical protein
MGKGRFALEPFSIAVNMKPMSYSSYDRHLVQKPTLEIKENLLHRARKDV